MNFYLVKRLDRYGYDDYIGCVIVAETPEKACEFLKEHYRDERYAWGNFDVEFILLDPKTYKEPAIIIESFNAG